MRTEQEVINQIMSYAVSVSDIQVVIRTNLVPVRKYLYSYEFYFIVENIEDFEAEETSMWKALDAMVLVFHMAGEKVATWIDTVFPEKQEQDMREFINRLKCSGRNFSN